MIAATTAPAAKIAAVPAPALSSGPTPKAATP